MEQIKQKIDLCFEAGAIPRLLATQLDTGRVYNFRVLDRTSKPLNTDGLGFKFYLSSGGKNGVVEGTRQEDGTFNVTVPNSMLIRHGKARVQLALTKEQEEVATVLGEMIISKSIGTGAVTGDDLWIDFSKIISAIAEIKNLDVYKISKELTEKTEQAKAVQTQLSLLTDEAMGYDVELKNRLAALERLIAEAGENKVLHEKISRDLTALRQESAPILQALSESIKKAEMLKVVVESADITRTTLQVAQVEAEKLRTELQAFVKSIDLNRYATQDQINTVLMEYTKTTQVNTLIQESEAKNSENLKRFLLKTELPDLTPYATKEAVSSNAPKQIYITDENATDYLLIRTSCKENQHPCFLELYFNSYSEQKLRKYIGQFYGYQGKVYLKNLWHLGNIGVELDVYIIDGALCFGLQLQPKQHYQTVYGYLMANREVNNRILSMEFLKTAPTTFTDKAVVKSESVFATNEDLQNIPTPDLTPYALKTEVDDKINNVVSTLENRGTEFSEEQIKRLGSALMLEGTPLAEHLIDVSKMISEYNTRILIMEDKVRTMEGKVKINGL